MTWYSWKHLRDVRNTLERQGISSPQARESLKRIIQGVSHQKKTFIYRSLQEMGYSEGTLNYLFNGWIPPEDVAIGEALRARVREVMAVSG